MKNNNTLYMSLIALPAFSMTPFDLRYKPVFGYSEESVAKQVENYRKYNTFIIDLYRGAVKEEMRAIKEEDGYIQADNVTKYFINSDSGALVPKDEYKA